MANANRTVTSLPPVVALGDDDVFYLVQGGDSRKATGAQIKAFIAPDLDALADVNAASPTSGDVLIWDDTANEWVAAPVPGSGEGGPVPDGGTTGQVLTKASGVDQDVDWTDPTNLVSMKLYAGLPNAADTVNVNSTSYVDFGSAGFAMDLGQFLFTQYKLILIASSSQAGQTITAQLTYAFSPGAPIHTGGNDVVVTNSFGVFDSGWKSKDDAITTGVVGYGVALKGSNSTVDLAVNAIMILLRK